MGSVSRYNVKEACLLLQHDHPHGNSITASVDVTLVLQTLGVDQTRVGEWLNVVGYVHLKPDEQNLRSDPKVITVQALLVWSAGFLNVQAYERSIDMQNT